MAKRRRRRRRINPRRRRSVRRNPIKAMLKKKVLGIPLGLIGLGAVGYWLWKKQKAKAMAYEPPLSIAVPSASGLGDYVTQDMVGTAGLGFDVATGADAFGSVSRADYAYDDTF